MIIPYSTDAPIYHYPVATLAMIAVNVAIHFAGFYLPEGAAEPYAMILGDGLHPLQWLTHNFLHVDIFHLFFNMVFLWSYGIIVEGKVGAVGFLVCYLLIGTVHGAAIQAAYLRASDTSYVLGASAIIFGLLAMAMIWAPVNELSCFFFFVVGFRVISNTFEVHIYTFAILTISLEAFSTLGMYLLRGNPMSSGFLHISGAFWGLIVGIVLVKLRWVDCEGWDVFSMLAKRKSLKKAWKAREASLDRINAPRKLPGALMGDAERPGLSIEERSAKLLAKVHRSIEAGDASAAQGDCEKWLKSAAPAPVPRDALMGVIHATLKREWWPAAVPAMRAFCRTHPEKADKVGLKLADILIRHLDRPTEALGHLQRMGEDRLDATQRQVRRKLLGDAGRLIEAGVLEVQEEV